MRGDANGHTHSDSNTGRDSFANAKSSIRAHVAARAGHDAEAGCCPVCSLSRLRVTILALA